jgi:hypothetical protein
MTIARAPCTPTPCARAVAGPLWKSHIRADADSSDSLGGRGFWSPGIARLPFEVTL